MTEAESSNIVPALKSEAMEQFPFKYPKLFTSILLHCGTKDIHAIRCCSIQVVKNTLPLMEKQFQVRLFQLASVGHSFLNIVEENASAGSQSS